MTKIHLIIIGLDWQTTEYNVLTNQENLKNSVFLPYELELSDDEDPEFVAKKIFSGICTISTDWIDLNIVSAIRNEETKDLEITYSCVIPNDSNIPEEHKWLSVNEPGIQFKNFSNLMKSIRGID